MKQKVILTQRYQHEAIEQLQEAYELIIVEDTGRHLEEILEENPDAAALICFLSDRIDKRVIGLGANLKIIANYAVGYNNIDVKYAEQKGILVTNTPDILSGTTADMAVALLLAVSRRIVEGDYFVRQGKFKGWSANLMLGKEINGTTMGIVGMGRIGLATALRVKALGMKIAYFSSSRKPVLEEAHSFQYMPFEELVREVDVVSLHIPSTPKTHHLFNKKTLDMMKTDAIFINVSRGNLVDEEYLADKLEKKELFGAGLDVYEYEPVITKKLKSLSNVVLAPHLGSATYTTRLGMAQMTVDNVRQALTGSTPQNLVDEFK